MLPADYQNVKRDSAITASDCPLLRLNAGYVFDDLWSRGDLVLRRCVVPKAAFPVDKVDGNTYEDIDFSYTNEFMGTKVSDRTYVCSHKQGLYTLYSASGSLTGRASYPDNTKDATGLTEGHDMIPLNGDLMESGAYIDTLGVPYENNKTAAINRVRTKVPIRTEGAVIPTVPPGYSIHHITYLDEELKTAHVVSSTGSFDTKYPYFVITFQKGDGTVPVSVSEFIALNVSLTVKDYTKVPEITGSAYVGAGCIVRGDVQLHGDPYVNRVFDENEWDRGGLNTAPGLTWDVMKDGRNSDVRMTTKSIYPVNPGDTISVSGAYRILLCWFNSDQKLMSDTGWNDGTITVPANVYYIGIALSTKPDLKFLDFPDIPLANVKYLRAFKKRRYITNELDRKSPEDVFLTEDQWRVAAISTGQAYIGRIYDTLIGSSTKYCILKRPINAGASWTVTLPDGVDNVYTPLNSSWDALTKLLGLGVKDNAALTGLELKKVSDENVTLKDVPAARFIVEFVPQPRIITPYGVSNLCIEGTKVRMYNNSVLSRTITRGQEVTLKGDAVMGSVFTGDVCICSNGHDDAIITKP